MRFISKSVYLEKENTLVIADLHLGYEEIIREQGVFIPKTQYKRIIEDLEEIFEEIRKHSEKELNKDDKRIIINNEKIKEVIILGDLKHEFSKALSQEWKEVLNLIEFLKSKAEKITIIKGNHDNYLINVIKNRENVRLVEFYIKNGNAFAHGNKIYPEILDKKIKTIILGHMHPAIIITKGVKKETYKCFLVGKFKDKKIIILPSFFPLTEGVDVNIEDTNLWFNLNLKNFDVYVVGDKIYDFGKLKDVGELRS